MINLATIVGKLNNKEERETKNGKKLYITVAVPRSYKNGDGIYETDYIDCILFQQLAEKTDEYCKTGDVIAVKGRLEKSKEDDSMVLVAEKVSFLSSKKGAENEKI